MKQHRNLWSDLEDMEELRRLGVYGLDDKIMSERIKCENIYNERASNTDYTMSVIGWCLVVTVVLTAVRTIVFIIMQ